MPFKYYSCLGLLLSIRSNNILTLSYYPL